MDKVFTRYLREDGKPYGFIAVDQEGHYGLSLCSPKDTFRKDLARRIALGRLAKKRATVDGVAAWTFPEYCIKERSAVEALLSVWGSMKEWLQKKGVEDGDKHE